MIRRLSAAVCTGLFAAAALSLAGCGGGGSSSAPAVAAAPAPAPVVTPAPPPLTNSMQVTVDGGPAALLAASNTYAVDQAFVTVTLCAPGTSVCQTIDHVALDTGSTGLRVLASVLTPALQAALPQQTDAAGGAVGECYGYVDGYAFGSVRTADATLGGASVAGLPLQVIGDGGAFATVPATCSAGGGANLSTVATLAANGIIGVGINPTDCGALCAAGSKSGAAAYYDCPASGCGAVIARAANTSPPFEQVPNPVAAMAMDNNGTVLSLPAVPYPGTNSITGVLYFGIGTRTNNALPATASVLTTTNNGVVTATYNGATYPRSLIDSGTNYYLFADSGIPQCTATNFKGFYCPASPLPIGLTLSGANGASGDASFTLYNAQTVLVGQRSAVPGVGATPAAFSNIMAVPNSFAVGLQFFFGRNVYTAISGRTAGGTVGPYYAF